MDILKVTIDENRVLHAEPEPELNDSDLLGLAAWCVGIISMHRKIPYKTVINDLKTLIKMERSEK